MNESSSGSSQEKGNQKTTKVLERPTRFTINNIDNARNCKSSILSSRSNTVDISNSCPDIASTCSLLKGDSSGTVTTAVYEAGGETTIVDGRTGTATVVEGAEVVRTVAVSYATPILHHVLLQGSPLIYSTVPTIAYTTASTVAAASSSPSPCVQDLSVSSSLDTRTRVEASEEKTKPPTNTGRSPGEKSPPSAFIIASREDNSKTSMPVLVISSQALSTSTCSSSSPFRRPLTSSTESNSMHVSISSSLSTDSVSTTSSTISAKSTFTSTSPTPISTSTQLSTSLPCLSSSEVTPPTLFIPSTLNHLVIRNASTNGTRNDDELTSLSWLQDSSFILGRALSPIKSASQSSDTLPKKDKKITLSIASPPPKSSASPDKREGTPEKDSELGQNGLEGSKDSKPEGRVSSPSSDLGDDDCEEPGELVINDDVSARPLSPAQKQPSVPYNPLLHVKTKPPYSFSCLIFMAIEESQTKALPVKDIYSWIVNHFPYYNTAPTGWKNSVRHNLSLNKCFRKVDKAPNLGKGSLWMVDPIYRPNLLQALSKSPLHPYSNVDRIYMIPNKAVLSSHSGLSKTENCPSVPKLTIRRDMCQHSPSSISSSASPESPNEVLESEERFLKSYASPLKETNSNRISDPTTTMPNADLFPLLAKRMGAEFNSCRKPVGPSGTLPYNIKTSIKIEDSLHVKGKVEEALLGQSQIKVESEDVDAAAAMLILKHGPRIIPTDKDSKFSTTSLSPSIPNTYFNKRKQKHNQLLDPDMVLISSSPSRDHEYISAGQHKNDAREGSQPTPPKDSKHSLHSFSSGEDEGIVCDLKNNCVRNNNPDYTSKEDALFNLASIATSLALGQMNGDDGSEEKPLKSHAKEEDDNRTPQQAPNNKRKAFQPKKSAKRTKISVDFENTYRKKANAPPIINKYANIIKAKTNNNNNNNNNNYVISDSYLSKSEIKRSLKVKKIKVVESS